jgi:hypothetical protein
VDPSAEREKYESAKLLKYQERCENESKNCIPIISETFGKSITTLKKITKIIFRKNDKLIGATFSQLMQQLSLSVQKSNVQMIKCRICTYSKVDDG